MKQEPRLRSAAVAGLVLSVGLGACAPTAPPATPATQAISPATGVAFTCGSGETIVANFPVGGETVVLDVEGERVELPRVPAASGAQFSDGSGTTFLTRGNAALLERGDRTYADCVRSQVPAGAGSAWGRGAWPAHSAGSGTWEGLHDWDRARTWDRSGMPGALP